MTEKRYDVIYEKEPRGQVVTDNGIPCTARTCCTRLNWLEEENKELKEINQDHQDYISLLEEEKINLQIKLQKIRDYAMENGEVKQDVIEKVVFE